MANDLRLLKGVPKRGLYLFFQTETIDDFNEAA